MMSHKINTGDDINHSQKNLTANESKEIFKKLGNSQAKILRFSLTSLGSFQNCTKDISILQKIDQCCDNNKIRLVSNIHK